MNSAAANPADWPLLIGCAYPQQFNQTVETVALVKRRLRRPCTAAKIAELHPWNNHNREYPFKHQLVQ